MAAIDPDPVHQYVNDITACPICKDGMTDPRALPCLHTFCLKCLKGYCSHLRPGKKAKCPLCRGDFDIPEGGIDDIQRNFYFQCLVTAKKETVADGSKQGDMSTASNQAHDVTGDARDYQSYGMPCQCDACLSRNVKASAASSFCTQCHQHLCDSCNSVHKALSHCSSHTVVELSTKRTNQSSASEIVILMIGETGVGKSTSINALNIYSQYDTLAEAESVAAHDLFLIPVKLAAFDQSTLEEVIITVGKEEDSNESHQFTGDSATQEPKLHIIKLPDVTITIIDTPGIGDTRGPEKDKENAHNILKCVADFQYLNAICVFLRPDQCRLNDRFRYCLNEILRNLDESAKGNIVICMTNSKTVNFKPGDTLPVLKRFMSEDETLKQIEISSRTVYFLENEAVRYLAKVKCGMLQADEDCVERRSVVECWEKSVDQTTKMLRHVANLNLHLVIGMTSINNARRTISNITPLLFYVVTCIIKTVKAIDEQTAEIEKRMQAINVDPGKHARYDLQELLYKKEYEIKVETLDHRMVVCVSAKCSRYVNGVLVHLKECDSRCRFAATLRRCTAMDSKGYCKHCGCHYKEHDWKTTRTTVIENRIINPRIVGNIMDKDDILSQLLGQLEELKCDRTQYITEKNNMLETCAKMSIFLLQNAMIKNDELNDFTHYVTFHIEVIKNSEQPVDRETQEALTEFQLLRHEYMETYHDISRISHTYNALNVKLLIEQLFERPLVGSKLKESLKIIERSSAEAMETVKITQVHSVSRVSAAFRDILI